MASPEQDGHGRWHRSFEFDLGDNSTDGGWSYDDEFGVSDEPVKVPFDAVKEADKENDTVLFLTAGMIGTALVTGYAIRRVVKNRKSKE